MSKDKIYFDMHEAIQTPAGRTSAIILMKSYLSMMVDEDRLKVLQYFCPKCGSINHRCEAE
jgi:hypothetical protein